MNFKEKQKIIHRILAGYLKCGPYRIYAPTFRLLYEADCIYDEIIEEHKYDEFISQNEALKILEEREIWVPEDDKQAEELDKKIENLQVKLYESYLRKSEHPVIKKSIEACRNTIDHIYKQKYSLHHITIEGLAEQVSKMYLVSKCSKVKDADILMKIIGYINKNIITVDQYRELARTDPWRTIWTLKKSNNFKRLTEERKLLCTYSMMYDSIYKNTEHPTDDVINDDDMLDGWLISQRREREQERRKTMTSKLTGMSDNDTGEVFIPVKTQEEANAIYEMNDIGTRVKLKGRQAYLKQAKGPIAEANLPDKQLELKMAANKEFHNKMKGS